MKERIVSEGTGCDTSGGRLTATSDSHAETPAQEPVPAEVVVATVVVVGGVVEVAGMLVVVVVVVVTVPPPDPPVSASFTEVSYLLFASTQSVSSMIGFPRNHTPYACDMSHSITPPNDVYSLLVCSMMVAIVEAST